MSASPLSDARAAEGSSLSPSVVVDDIAFAYGRRRAPVVRGLSTSFGPFSTVLLGPNGAGKSTLLRLMAGSLRPRSGRISTCGQIAFSPQTHVALPGFSVFDQIKYAGWLGGLSVGATQCAARRSLDAVKLVELAGRQATTLSGGERARLGIACALSTNPDLLLLDEPSASLDPVARATVREVLCELARSGTCVIATSHTAVDIGPPFERLVVLDAGDIVFDGSPEAFFDGDHQHPTVIGFSRALRAGR